MDNSEPVRVIVKLPGALFQRVEDYRFENRCPDRASAIRDMLAYAAEHLAPKPLKAAGKGGK